MANAKELIKAAEMQIKKILDKSGHNHPFPKDFNSENIPPIQFLNKYETDYLRSYGQDSLFFRALKEHKLLGNFCSFCKYTYATPKTSCMYCGQKTKWIELPTEATVHSFTVCYESSKAFLSKVPYSLAVFEFEFVDTLFFSMFKKVDFENPASDWIGTKAKAKFSKALRNPNHIPTIIDVWFEPIRN